MSVTPEDVYLGVFPQRVVTLQWLSIMAVIVSMLSELSFSTGGHSVPLAALTLYAVIGVAGDNKIMHSKNPGRLEYQGNGGDGAGSDDVLEHTSVVCRRFRLLGIGGVSQILSALLSVVWGVQYLRGEDTAQSPETNSSHYFGAVMAAISILVAIPLSAHCLTETVKAHRGMRGSIRPSSGRNEEANNGGSVDQPPGSPAPRCINVCVSGVLVLQSFV